jgi:hypothetical protein
MTTEENTEARAEMRAEVRAEVAERRAEGRRYLQCPFLGPAFVVRHTPLLLSSLGLELLWGQLHGHRHHNALRLLRNTLLGSPVTLLALHLGECTGGVILAAAPHFLLRGFPLCWRRIMKESN